MRRRDEGAGLPVACFFGIDDEAINLWLIEGRYYNRRALNSMPLRVRVHIGSRHREHPPGCSRPANCCTLCAAICRIISTQCFLPFSEEGSNDDENSENGQDHEAEGRPHRQSR
jgi:hypothetical protein